jgi:hypothetical protein
MRRFPATPALEESGAMNETWMVAELAARNGDGFEVRLFWSRRSGALWVDVLHPATCERFTIDADPAKALDVYYHPFAYCVDAGPELVAAA